MSFRLNKIVEVEWRDACFRGGWDDIENYERLDPMNCKTVGYLLKKDKNKIIVGQTQSEDACATGGISIPLPWIKKIRTLK